jgi:type VII secretion-associated protein (TIGR03931 family)
VDVGRDGTEVAYLRAGRVVAVRVVAVGGALLDGVTAQVLARADAAVRPDEARRVREALSLLPQVRAGTPPVTVSAADLRAALAPPLGEVVDAARAVVAAVGPVRAPPVLLVGGVARTPLLAELLDAELLDAELPDAGLPDAGLPDAGLPDAGLPGGVHVVDRPDTAAVTGALRVAVPAPPAGHGVTARRVAAPAPRAAPAHVWLPPLGTPRRSRAVAGVLAAVVAAVGLLVAGAGLPLGPAPPVTSTSPAGSFGELVQYGYAARLPPGWAHTGGLPERRRSLLTPTATPDGSDLISIERTPLGYDAGAEPERARRELRAEFATAVAAGAPLSGLADDARYAGRSVVSYREADAATGTDVDWYVVLDGDAQLSVGCRATPAGTDAVGAACATVVGSLRRTR